MLLGAAIVVVLGAAFLFVTNHGSPSWLAGQEREVFIKLALVTIVLTLLDVVWRVEAQPKAEAEATAPADRS
jgi:hypothetical protein